MNDRWAKGVVLAAVAALFLAAQATAIVLPDNKDELKCTQGMSKSLAKFVGKKQKCVTKCWKLFSKGQVPASDCVPPFGGATLACIADPTKGAEAKTLAAILKKCPPEGCPECYSGGDCNLEATSQVSTIEGLFDGFTLVVYCDDSGSGDGLTKGEAKCQDTTAKTLSKFNASKVKCYDKCVKAEFGGKIAPGSCGPPPTDPKTIDCISKAEDKSVGSIDKVCSIEAPECYGATDGTAWTALVEATVDNAIDDVYCGSPGGAFLD